MLRQPCLTLALFSTLAVTPLFAVWRPVNPEDLTLTKSKTNPNADVEVLFREVRVLNDAATFGYPTNIVSEYIRLKVFTARGKDKYTDVTIPYFDKNIVSNVEGRTIKPDGTIVDLRKSDIFDKVIEKKGGQKVKVISFAMPGVEPGSIVEYRWMNNKGEHISRYIPLEVQSEYPVDEVSFHIKPVTNAYVQWPAMRYLPFGCNPDKMTHDAEGFSVLTIHNVPAYREEPWMPPSYAAKQWLLVYYEDNDNSGKDKYWTSLGRQIYGDYSKEVKVNGEVKSIAEEVISGASSDDEKIGKLLKYCRANLKNIYGEDISNAERARAVKENNTSLDTLHRKTGTPREINLAFIALAMGAGFDARLAELSDRGTFLFTPAQQSGFFLNGFDSAVKVNGKWKFYDVATPYLAPGVLNWREQGVYALVADPKNSEFVQTPLLTAKETQLQRMGILTLSADGVLEGDIRELFYGNKAIEWRQRFSRSNDEHREQSVHDEIKQRFADFDITKLGFNVPEDLTAPVGLHYHIVVRGYAQRTGKRLFVLPNYFEVGYQSRFTDSVRTQGVYFEYPWSEIDSIELQLPEGYSLDHADAPGGLNFAPVGNFVVQISVTKTNKISYRRQLTFGNDSLLSFEVKAYPTIKQIFETIRLADNHTLTLKADAPAAPGQ